MRILPFRKPTPPPMDPDSLLTLDQINKLPADKRCEIRMRYGEILMNTQGVARFVDYRGDSTDVHDPDVS